MPLLLLPLAGCGGSAQPAPAATARPTDAQPRFVFPTLPAPTSVQGPLRTLVTVSPTPASRPLLHGPPYTVVIDPGHGGAIPGAVHADASGRVELLEKDVNLDVARRLSALLSDAGYLVVLTRDGDYSLGGAGLDYRSFVLSDLQARIDIANAEQADVLVSVHFNGLDDTRLQGTEVYVNPDRDFGRESETLAFFVHDSLLTAMAKAGYQAQDRGVKNDAEVGGDQSRAHSILLGTNPGFRAALMPGIIGEALFITNDADVAFLRTDAARQAIAEGYAAGIQAYFAWLTGR